MLHKRQYNKPNDLNIDSKTLLSITICNKLHTEYVIKLLQHSNTRSSNFHNKSQVKLQNFISNPTVNHYTFHNPLATK